MLNQALNEIQIAIDTLSISVYPETNPDQLAASLDEIIQRVDKTVEILQTLEESFSVELSIPISHVY